MCYHMVGFIRICKLSPMMASSASRLYTPTTNHEPNDHLTESVILKRLLMTIGNINRPQRNSGLEFCPQAPPYGCNRSALIFLPDARAAAESSIDRRVSPVHYVLAGALTLSGCHAAYALHDRKNSPQPIIFATNTSIIEEFFIYRHNLNID